MPRELAASIGSSEHLVQARGNGDSVFTVVVDGVEKEVDAVRVRVGVWSLIVDGRSYLVDLDERRAGLFVLAAGTVTPITLEDAQRRRLASAVHAAHDETGEVISAPIAGRVVKLSVEVGDEVAVGDSTIVLEAMKMENDIRAERGGTVAKIHVEAGNSVETGQKLITLE